MMLGGALRVRAGAVCSAPMSNGWTPATLGERICQILREDLLSVEDDFSASSNLIECGLDSLALTQLLLAIQEETSVWVDESLLTPEVLETSLSLASCVHGLLEQG
jgi:acyl carrier protein